MSSPLPPTVKQPFIPEYRTFKTLDDDFLTQINAAYSDIARYMNARVIGLFDEIQANTGEKWFDNNRTDGAITRRQSYRKVFFNETFTATQNHGIVGITAFTDFRVMAQGNDGFFYKGPSNVISMRCSTTQIELINNTGTTLTNVIIVVEFLLN